MHCGNSVPSRVHVPVHVSKARNVYIILFLFVSHICVRYFCQICAFDISVLCLSLAPRLWSLRLPLAQLLELFGPSLEHLRQSETKWDKVRQSETKWDKVRQSETKWDKAKDVKDAKDAKAKKNSGTSLERQKRPQKWQCGGRYVSWHSLKTPQFQSSFSR